MRRRSSLTVDKELNGIDRFKQFFLSVYTNELRQMLRKKNKRLYYSLYFNFMELMDKDCKLADYLILHPDRALEYADSAVCQAQETIYNKINDKYKQCKPNDIINDEPNVSIKYKCKARLHGQLYYDNNQRPTVSHIRSKDVSSIIQIRGTVIRQSKAKLLESSRKYECLQCHFQFTVHADIINEKDIEFPKQCQNYDRNCKSLKFAAITDSTEAIDFQEIALQEQIQKLGLGKIPRSIRCVLTCDLADSCQPGDDIQIIGIVRYHWNTINIKKADQRFDIQMYIEAISLQQSDNAATTNNDINISHANYRAVFDNFWSENGHLSPVRARNMILANLCPQLCGMYIIKLAVALTIIGGVYREEYGTRIRGQSHLLLVGDPGTGKSQLLRYAARMSTRSVLTTGVGTTSAGLTVSAVKDGAEWVLEAGALVLADGGICCIDEFGSVREHDRGVIHEAMEQQTISVAKGGFVCSLNSRSTVLAAMNPPSGGFDECADLSLNTNMASSLLSRFDVILLLLDQKNDEWDRKVGQHLMDNLCEPEFPKIDYLISMHDDDDDDEHMTPYNLCSNTPIDNNHNNNNNNNNNNMLYGHQPEWNSTAAFERDMQRFDEMREERVHWTIDEMQAYFTIIRGKKKVEFSDEAETILSQYYQLQRSREHRDKSRTTIRLLESLIRLAQAHCRLMYREVVLPLDAIQAVYLMEKSLCTTGSISDFSCLQTIFPSNPQQDYNKNREEILNMLFPKEYRKDRCAQFEDVQFDYKEDIKNREIAEMEKMMNDEPDMMLEEDWNGGTNQTDDGMNNNNNKNNKNNKNINDNDNDNNDTFDDWNIDCNDNDELNMNINGSQHEFAKPTRSLMQQYDNNNNNNNDNDKSNNNDNSNNNWNYDKNMSLAQIETDSEHSVSPLNPIHRNNNNNNNDHNKDSPPLFRKRRSISNNSSNNNINNDNINNDNINNNDNNNNDENKDSPPLFRKRRSVENNVNNDDNINNDNDDNNNKNDDAPPLFRRRRSNSNNTDNNNNNNNINDTICKEGELSHSVSNTLSEKQNFNAICCSLDTQQTPEGHNRNNRKRSRQQMVDDNDNNDNNDNDINNEKKRRRLNDNQSQITSTTLTTANTSQLSLNSRKNTEEHLKINRVQSENPSPHSKQPTLTSIPSAQNTQNTENTEKNDINFDGMSSWDELDNNHDNEWDFDFDETNINNINNKNKSEDNNKSQSKKKRKKKFF